MSRNLKVLGLALVAVFALSAMAASAASAAPKFTTTSGATGTATQIGAHKFTVTGQTVTCSTANFTGTASSAAPTSIAMSAAYSGCKSEPLGAEAKVTGFGAKVGEGCWYVIGADGSAELTCASGDVTVEVLTCTVHVPAQKFPAGSIVFGNVAGEPDDITAEFNIEKIKATHTDGFGCPFSSSGESESAILEGKSTVRAEEGSTPVGLTWDEK